MQYGRLFSCKPSKPLANTLMQWIGAQEYIYNAKVGEDRYYRTYARKYMPIGTFPEVNQQYSQFKGEDNQWLKTIPSQVLRNGATKWAQSYQRFFAKLGGRPKIQKRGNGKRSVWLTRELFRFVERINSDGVITHHIQIGTQSKPLGYLPFVAHKTYAIPNSIHISIRGGKWFVSFNNDDGNQEPTDEEIANHLKTFTREELLAKSIGIDRGVVLPFAKSDGTSGGFSLIQKRLFWPSFNIQPITAKTMAKTMAGYCVRKFRNSCIAPPWITVLTCYKTYIIIPRQGKKQASFMSLTSRIIVVMF